MPPSSSPRPRGSDGRYGAAMDSAAPLERPSVLRQPDLFDGRGGGDAVRQPGKPPRPVPAGPATLADDAPIAALAEADPSEVGALCRPVAGAGGAGAGGAVAALRGVRHRTSACRAARGAGRPGASGPPQGAGRAAAHRLGRRGGVGIAGGARRGNAGGSDPAGRVPRPAFGSRGRGGARRRLRPCRQGEGRAGPPAPGARRCIAGDPPRSRSPIAATPGRATRCCGSSNALPRRRRSTPSRPSRTRMRWSISGAAPSTRPPASGPRDAGPVGFRCLPAGLV